MDTASIDNTKALRDANALLKVMELISDRAASDIRVDHDVMAGYHVIGRVVQDLLGNPQLTSFDPVHQQLRQALEARR